MFSVLYSTLQLGIKQVTLVRTLQGVEREGWLILLCGKAVELSFPFSAIPLLARFFLSA